jgi:membrane protease YdiL (CAAX protease family)
MTSSARVVEVVESVPRRLGPVLLLLAGLAVAVAIRQVVSGTAGPRSDAGALTFALCLAALCAASGVRLRVGFLRGAAAGTAGGVLLAGVALARLGLHVTASRPMTGFAGWLLVTALVAITEEALLRGVLFAHVTRLHGDRAAVLVTAVAFAVLHVPLYGWQVLPLDVAVGVVLGILRLVSGTWVAPAVAHVLADAAGWWLY